MYERADLGAGASPISLETARSLLRELYGRCAWHGTESQVVWRMYVAFESAHSHGDEATELLHQMYIARLQVPHQRTYSRLTQNWLRLLNNFRRSYRAACPRRRTKP